MARKRTWTVEYVPAPDGGVAAGAEALRLLMQIRAERLQREADAARDRERLAAATAAA